MKQVLISSLKFGDIFRFIGCSNIYTFDHYSNRRSCIEFSPTGCKRNFQTTVFNPNDVYVEIVL